MTSPVREGALETVLGLFASPFIWLWEVLTPLAPFRRPNVLKWPLVLVSVFSLFRFFYYLKTGDETLPIGIGTWVIEIWALPGKFPTFPGPIPVNLIYLVIVALWIGFFWGYRKLTLDEEREVYPITHLQAAWICLIGLILVCWSRW